MIIFSTVFKILNKLKGNLILYTVILLAITLFNTTSGNMNHYEATKPDILIVNKDQNNEITKGFVSYLKEQATLKDIDINDQEKVDDALFYRDISYVVYIPENFGDDLVNDKNPTIEYKSNGNENASFTKMLIEKYIKTVNLYKEHYQGKALNQKVKQVINQKTKVKLNTSLDSSKLNQVNVYFNFLNYALLAGDRAVFTPNNSNGTIRIKKNGTNTDITTLKLVQGRVTKQMNKGIIESSKHNFDMFKGGYGSPSYNTNQWKPEYAQNLNQYTAYSRM